MRDKTVVNLGNNSQRPRGVGCGSGVCVVNILEGIIAKQVSKRAARSFKSTALSFYGNGVTVSTLTETEQIEKMNRYFRNALLKYPSPKTISVREWLVSCDNVNVYADEFENHWLDLLNQLDFFAGLQ